MTSVKSHFRGQRDFFWNEYHVLIFMPGFHHRSLLDLTLGAKLYNDDEDVPEGPDYLDNVEFTERLARHLNREGAAPSVCEALDGGSKSG